MSKYTPHEASLLVLLAQHPTQDTLERIQDRLGVVAMEKARDILARPDSPRIDCGRTMSDSITEMNRLHLLEMVDQVVRSTRRIVELIVRNQKEQKAMEKAIEQILKYKRKSGGVYCWHDGSFLVTGIKLYNAVNGIKKCYCSDTILIDFSEKEQERWDEYLKRATLYTDLYFFEITGKYAS